MKCIFSFVIMKNITYTTFSRNKNRFFVEFVIIIQKHFL